MGVFGSLAKFLTSRTRQKPDGHARRLSEVYYYGTERLPRVWPPKRSHALTKWMPSDLVGMPHHFLRPSCQLLSSQTFAAWSILGFLTCLCSFSAVCMRLRHFINRPVGLRRPGPGTSQVPTHLAAFFVSLLPPYLCLTCFQLHNTITHWRSVLCIRQEFGTHTRQGLSPRHPKLVRIGSFQARLRERWQ